MTYKCVGWRALGMGSQRRDEAQMTEHNGQPSFTYTHLERELRVDSCSISQMHFTETRDLTCYPQ